ncbi:hypothetical protein HYH02_007627 [Chlamydomonas schloesseri]|uniref:tRNA-uridine aminocarboxypropyltransferase n=1 Tax=Chlamydomonas schloesseri TaxID=2026947 RepID=A0A835WGW0_9CHLO|nr:hypothetical protein HYH02_007627 [Chlamydomonas schloesseri]|eukprot:KAG2447297.1 hypothetical protein HYH02_007627 [Chlamydomonas schloesseri]
MLDGLEFGDLAGSSSDSDGAAQQAAKRRDCPRCNRPPRVCVCPALPDAPLRLRGQVFILQHPYELKKRMATVPLLTRCLDEASLRVLPARRLQQPGKSPETDAMLEGAARGDYPLYLLFPGPDATDLAEVAESETHAARLQAAAARLGAQQPGPGDATGAGAGPAVSAQAAAAAASSAAPAADTAAAAADSVAGCCESGPPQAQQPQPQVPQPAYLLVVVDGTWRQAKEMFKHVAGRCLPPDGPGVQVSLKPSDVLPLPPPAAAAAPLNQAEGGAAVAACQPAEAGRAAQGRGSPGQDGARADAGAPADADVDAHANADAGSSGSGGDPLQYDPNMPCLIRKEPVEGFVTTYEATARALGLLEGRPDLADTLLAPLRLMTRLQAAFDPAIRSRMLQQPEPPKPLQGKAPVPGQVEGH